MLKSLILIHSSFSLAMAATAKAEKKKQYEDKLRQFPNFHAILGAADAGIVGDDASTVTAATTDFQTDADERS